MISELRQDPVSGDWIVVAASRGKRPHQFLKKTKRVPSPRSSCPFENPQKTGHGEPLIIYTSASSVSAQTRQQAADLLDTRRGDWILQVVPNKYPAFFHKDACASIIKTGPYSITEAVGHHDLVITRDHYKNFAHLNKSDAALVFKAFQERYRMLAKDVCLAYISIFHNWGPKAGASIYHPHYQIISLPVVPPDIYRSLSGSKRYFERYKKCVHCAMVNWEKKQKKRIILENKHAVALAPYASRKPFEIRIFPKDHLPYFEDAQEKEIASVVSLLQQSLLQMEKSLADSDYNFFIHTAPLDTFDGPSKNSGIQGHSVSILSKPRPFPPEADQPLAECRGVEWVDGKKRYDNYHWHIEVLPQLSISAGFELGTGIDITVVDPDEAAALLRK